MNERDQIIKNGDRQVQRDLDRVNSKENIVSEQHSIADGYSRESNLRLKSNTDAIAVERNVLLADIEKLQAEQLKFRNEKAAFYKSMHDSYAQQNKERVLLREGMQESPSVSYAHLFFALLGAFLVLASTKIIEMVLAN